AAGLGAGAALGGRAGGQGKGDAQGVAGDVDGVGEQDERAGVPGRDRLDEHHGEGEAERRPEASAVPGAEAGGAVRMVVSHVRWSLSRWARLSGRKVVRSEACPATKKC